jgi:hypothetical protein
MELTSVNAISSILAIMFTTGVKKLLAKTAADHDDAVKWHNRS